VSYSRGSFDLIDHIKDAQKRFRTHTSSIDQ